MKNVLSPSSVAIMSITLLTNALQNPNASSGATALSACRTASKGTPHSLTRHAATTRNPVG
jgi:hypothetical protein